MGTGVHDVWGPMVRAAAVGAAAAPAALVLVGFSPAGPVGGSLAALYQSASARAGGAVAAGSWFAAAQSAAMTGSAAAVGAATGAAAALGRAWR